MNLTNTLSDGIKRVFIFEPCLGRMTGHWESNIRNFTNELERRGLKVNIFCQTNPGNQILEQYKVTPIFSGEPFNDITSISAFNEEYGKYLDDFRKIDKSIFNKEDLLLFPTLLPQILKAAMEWLSPIIASTGPNAALLFLIPANDFQVNTEGLRHRIYSKLTRYKLFRKFLFKRLYMWSSSAAHVAHYMSYADLFVNKNKSAGYHYFGCNEEYSMNFQHIFKVPVKELPFSTTSQEPHRGQNTPTRDKNMIKVGYFGHASLEKGAQFLEYIVNKTLTEFKNVEFCLHLNPNIHTVEILKKLADKPIPNVTFYHGHRSYSELVDLIHSVDITLLPYSPSKYAGSPSMVYTEAIGAENVLVLPNYTWLARESATIHAGYTLFNSYNQDSIANALITAIKKFKTLKKMMPHARKRFLEKHNIVRYMDLILNDSERVRANETICLLR